MSSDENLRDASGSDASSRDRLNHGLARSILELGEEHLGDLVHQLLASDRFVQAFQGALTSSLSAKRLVDRNLVRMLTLLNVPTLEDVDELRDKLNTLEDMMTEIHERIAGLPVRGQAPSAAPETPRRRARKKSDS